MRRRSAQRRAKGISCEIPILVLGGRAVAGNAWFASELAERVVEPYPSQSIQCRWNARPVMKKLVLLSVIIAAIAIPVRAAKIKNQRVALKRTLVRVAIFNIIYVFLVLFVWHRL